MFVYSIEWLLRQEGGTKLFTNLFNPIRPGLFSRSPGPGGAQRPRRQKSRLTSTN